MIENKFTIGVGLEIEWDNSDDVVGCFIIIRSSSNDVVRPPSLILGSRTRILQGREEGVGEEWIEGVRAIGSIESTSIPLGGRNLRDWGHKWNGYHFVSELLLLLRLCCQPESELLLLLRRRLAIAFPIGRWPLPKHRTDSISSPISISITICRCRCRWRWQLRFARRSHLIWQWAPHCHCYCCCCCQCHPNLCGREGTLICHVALLCMYVCMMMIIQNRCSDRIRIRNTTTCWIAYSLLNNLVFFFEEKQFSY